MKIGAYHYADLLYNEKVPYSFELGRVDIQNEGGRMRRGQRRKRMGKRGKIM